MNVIEPLGFITKDNAVAMAEKMPPWTDVEMTDVEIRELTPECVALAYHAHARRAEGMGDNDYFGTLVSIYVRRADKWKLALSCHQPWKPKES